MYDFLVVGSGFYGSVFAQQAAENGMRVKVIDKRNHIGGNCYSYVHQDTGVIVHQYGTHIFHCESERVWNYVNRFSQFNRYQHRVLTTHKGQVYAMPINLGTINQFYGTDLRPKDVDAFIAEKRPRIENPSNLEEMAISLIGTDLYEAFIKGYTEKQWGCKATELPANIITRLPVRSSFHDSYFNDYYQGIPVEGYTPIFERMLKGVDVELGVDFFEDKEEWRKQAKMMVYTGPIDQYFNYEHGKLNWRSVRFEVERVDVEDYQGTSVMNYADPDVEYTRIHEPKHLHRERKHVPNTSVIIREFSAPGGEDPYYPVNLGPDKEMYTKYQEMANDEKGIIFGGRLAEYRYYDMHQVIGASLAKSKEVLSGGPSAQRRDYVSMFSGDSKRYTLTVVMPVYNERDCIVRVVEDWLETLARCVTRFRILVINDGSRDDTAEVLKYFDHHRAVEVINKDNSGHGPTILKGYKIACEDSDWVFQCDSDDEMPPDHFPLLWEKRHEYDALFGYRVNRSQSAGRRVMTLGSRTAIRFFFGSGVKDVNTPYRLMRSWFLREIVDTIPDDTFAPNILIAGLATKEKLRVLNYPVLHENRKTGRVSIVKWGLVKAAFRALFQTIKFGYAIRLQDDEPKTSEEG